MIFNHMTQHTHVSKGGHLCKTGSFTSVAWLQWDLYYFVSSIILQRSRKWNSLQINDGVTFLWRTCKESGECRQEMAPARGPRAPWTLIWQQNKDGCAVGGGSLWPTLTKSSREANWVLERNLCVTDLWMVLMMSQQPLFDHPLKYKVVSSRPWTKILLCVHFQSYS